MMWAGMVGVMRGGADSLLYNGGGDRRGEGDG